MNGTFRLVLLLLVSTPCVYAQPCTLTLKGRIMDENSVNPLDAAIVAMEGTFFTAITDERGRFQLNGLCVGNITLRISHIGCEPLLVSFYLQRDTLIKLKLNHEEHEIQEVAITAAKRESHHTQNTVTIESKQLDNLRGLSLGETLKKIPGVYSMNTGATISKPVIHGLHSNRVLILNNGVRLESQQWGSEHAPEIDPYVAKRILVVKGANSLRYGSDAIGGVILVEPEPLPVRHGVAGDASMAFFSNNVEGNFSATLEGCHHRIPAFSWRINGTYRRAGNSRSPDYWLGNTGVEEGNFSVALGYKQSRRGVEIYFSRFQTRLGILSAAHTGNLSDLQQAIERGKPLTEAQFSYTIERPYQQVTHYLTKANAYFQLKDGSNLSLQFAWQDNERFEYDKPHSYQQDKTRPGFYFQIQTINTDLEWRHRQIKNVSGALGISAVTQTNNFKYAYFIPDFWNFGGGVFAVERWTKGNFELEGGLRFDYKWAQYFIRTTSLQFDTALNFYAPSGNIGLEYHPKNNCSWRMNFGSAFRAPAPNELFADGVHHGAATYETGNRYLKPEQSFNLSTSVDFKSDFFSVNAEVFTNYILHFINLVPVQPPRLTIRGAFPLFAYQQQNALLSGSDVELTLKPQKDLEFYNKSSLLFARNVSTRDWLEQMPPLRFENGVKYTTAVNKKLKEVFAAASVVNVLQQTFLPKKVRDYAPAPSAYWLLNFEAGANFSIRQNNISVSLTIDNAANFNYRDYLDRFRYYADARGINCALRLKWNFFIPEH